MKKTNICWICRGKARDKEPDLLYCSCGEYIGGLSGSYCNKCRIPPKKNTMIMIKNINKFKEKRILKRKF